MVSEQVMTEHHVLGHQIVADSVGLGCYPLDCHNVQRFVSADGYALVEGGVYQTGHSPYPISYRSIVPRRTECENLLAPLSLSASHVAFLSIRMEPRLHYAIPVRRHGRQPRPTEPVRRAGHRL